MATKTVNGKQLPQSAFAYCPNPDEPSTWKLRIDDARHVGGAIAALGPKGYRGEKTEIPETDRAKVVAKVRAAWKKFHPDANPDEMPEELKASEPTVSDVHVNRPLGDEEDDDDGDESYAESDDDSDEGGAGGPMEEDGPPPAETPSRNFLTKLVTHLKGMVRPDEYDEAMRKARGHAGGKARKAKKASDDDEQSDREPPTRSYAEAIEALAFADAPEWIPFLPKPGTYTHPSYGEIKLTAERIDRFLKNFRDAVYQKQIPIDAEHQTKLSGATGWIQALRKNSEGAVDARVDWTDRGRTFLEENRFKYFSPEWYDDWTDPATGKKYQDVVIGGALTTRPFFKEGSLRPLAASETGPARTWLPIQHTQKGAEMADKEHEHKHTHPDGTEHSHEHAHAASVDMGAEGHDEMMHEHSHKASEQVSQRFAEMEAELKAFREKAAAQETALKSASEQIAAMREEAQTKRFTDEVLGKSSANGSRWVGAVEKHVTMLKKLAKAFGEDSEELRDYIAEHRATAEQIRKSALFTEVGSDAFGENESAEHKIDGLVRKAMVEQKLNYDKALEVVTAENPDLYMRYRRETSTAVGQ